MLHWEAAFVVLFERTKKQKPDWDSGPGDWYKYTDVASQIIQRKLVHTTADRFSQSVGRIMRDYGEQYIEHAGGKSGLYRIRSYADSAGKYEWLRNDHPVHFPVPVPIFEDVEVRAGAGFGDPAENKLVEEAAVVAVRTHYENDGWVVKTVEREKRGFDLDCRKGQAVENVEVKGVRGTKQSFIITIGEVKQARTNPLFVLIVVTLAMSKSPVLTRYSGVEFDQRFELTALQFRAVLPGD